MSGEWKTKHADESWKAVDHPVVQDVMREFAGNMRFAFEGLPAYGLRKIALYAAQVARAQCLGFVTATPTPPPDEPAKHGPGWWECPACGFHDIGYREHECAPSESVQPTANDLLAECQSGSSAPAFLFSGEARREAVDAVLKELRSVRVGEHEDAPPAVSGPLAHVLATPVVYAVLGCPAVRREIEAWREGYMSIAMYANGRANRLAAALEATKEALRTSITEQARLVRALEAAERSEAPGG